jgi:hypothetical protein
MQIVSFVLVNDKTLHQFEKQLEITLQQMPSPQNAFRNLVPTRLQELGAEHPISIPLGSFLPLDQAAERQHERVFSAFEDASHPSKLGQLAKASNTPIYYVSPGRVHEFVYELESLHLSRQLRPEDVETLLSRRIAPAEMPTVTRIIEQFRHDLLQVYHDAVLQGKGVVVLVINQPEEMTAEQGYPRAA